MKLLLTSSFANVKESLSSLINKPYKSVKAAFITTASNPYKGNDLWWVKKDKDALESLRIGNLEEIDIAEVKGEALKLKLEEKDLIFVTGGNTVYLLEQAQESNFLSTVKDLVKSGTVYAGSSAGSILAGPNIELEKNADERKNPSKLDSYKGLGFVDFIVQPHWNSEALKEEYMSYIDEIYNCQYPLLTLNDNQAVLVAGGKMEIVQNKDG